MNGVADRQLALARQALAGLQTELDAARRRVADLTEELEATNRGIIALHTELGAAREAENRALAEQEVLAERDRIARDLQSQVTHRLFRVALTLQGVLSLIDHPQAVQRLRAVITAIDATLRDLRNAIFELDHLVPEEAGLRDRFADLVNEADRSLGITTSIAFDGPAGAAVPDRIVADLLDVTREALTSLARDAATTADVTLRAGPDELVLHVYDHRPGRCGLSAVDQRVHTDTGTMRVTALGDTGARLEWRVSLSGAEPGTNTNHAMG